MVRNTESIDWYNNNSTIYKAHVRNPNESIYHAYYEKPAMYEALPDLNNKKVLSLGCGTGEDSHYLKNRGASESVGIDASKEMIKIASDSYPECSFELMNMQNIKFGNESFDFIYSSLAIHYIEYWDNVLSEAFRILKPNEYFLFSCEHPIYTAMDSLETKKTITKELSYSRDKMTKDFTVVGNYVEHRKLIKAEWPVTTWHKSIGEISREIKNSGFIISEIIEPKPKSEMKKVSERTFSHLSKIPSFIIFKLYKPL